ncbi:MAG: response regulator transcription factor [Planctomycetes bacterium]|nr:response regulator transcription factor [Planctomycetota bacterium]
MIRVFVADDQELVRSGLCSLLGLAAGIEVCGSAADGEAALRGLEQLAAMGQPAQVLLLDVRMPGLSGLEVLERLQGSATRVIVVTTFPDEEVLVVALRRGAAGYLLKDASFEELVQAIETVAKGGRAIRPVSPTSGRPPDARSAAAPEPTAPGTLTAREKEILRLLAAGLSNKEIASALANAEGTIKNHVSNILAKLHARDRTQAVLLALQQRLL